MKYLPLLLLLSGCSLLDPDNEIRVTEYNGTGTYLEQATGEVDGCRAVQSGKVAGCMIYRGKTCDFRSADCEPTEVTAPLP